MSAPSADVVWVLVAGSRLFRSGDRGSTWVEHALPVGARNPVISFVSDRDGFVAAVEPSSTGCQSQPAAIWRTSDGASTWQQVAAGGIDAAPCVASLSFTDGQHGFVAALDARSGPVILRTADGGKTWASSRALSDPPDLPMQGGRADMRLGPVQAHGSLLLLSAEVRSGSAVPTTHVYSSSDGGASWAHAASMPSSGDLVFVTASRWLRIGPPGASFESNDAGATWHAYASDYQQAAPIAPEVVFADANVGYATVRGGLQRTTDAGAHWTTLKTPGTE